MLFGELYLYHKFTSNRQQPSSIVYPSIECPSIWVCWCGRIFLNRSSLGGFPCKGKSKGMAGILDLKVKWNFLLKLNIVPIKKSQSLSQSQSDSSLIHCCVPWNAGNQTTHLWLVLLCILSHRHGVVWYLFVVHWCGSKEPFTWL